jgi:Transposase DDE domain
VFRHLDHAAFERVLGEWFAAQGLQVEEAIAIDGKTLRGIHGEEVPGVHWVAAFAHQTRTVLAQAATVGKGHELKGVEAVLATLPACLLCGQVVTGDALLAQRALCRQIVEKGGTIASC